MVTTAIEPWQTRGACRQVPTERFFSPDNERGRARDLRIRAAKSVCAHCPVLSRCRDHALRTREPYGVWGGLDEQERAELRRRSRYPARPA
ncbi:WhiB family transcriptional regulator [Actinokineospora sp. NBRC 105648]|uniref:WhiB family transcriptional regulator n=1 Tax=Actinokineospora sp. NBRC 105648 TaxID=3032206 RepID=UPI002553D11A|nr:WhiB family transcriptional regulator [Actinokineospora sp. NBRC 105648]